MMKILLPDTLWKWVCEHATNSDVSPTVATIKLLKTTYALERHAKKLHRQHQLKLEADERELQFERELDGVITSDCKDL